MDLISRADARAAGLKRFFSGKKCPQGHVAERFVSNGICAECLALRKETWRRSPAGNAKRRATRNAHRQANLDSERAKGRRRYADDAPRKARLMREYRANNPDRVAATAKRTRKKNAAKVRTRNDNRRAMQKGAEGRYSAEDIAAIRKMQRDRCADPLCRRQLKGRGTVDHIVALNKGGTNHRRNLQLLCRSCNSRKHDHDPIDHNRGRGLLL